MNNVREQIYNNLELIRKLKFKLVSISQQKELYDAELKKLTDETRVLLSKHKEMVKEAASEEQISIEE